MFLKYPPLPALYNSVYYILDHCPFHTSDPLSIDQQPSYIGTLGFQTNQLTKGHYLN